MSDPGREPWQPNPDIEKSDSQKFRRSYSEKTLSKSRKPKKSLQKQVKSDESKAKIPEKSIPTKVRYPETPNNYPIKQQCERVDYEHFVFPPLPPIENEPVKGPEKIVCSEQIKTHVENQAEKKTRYKLKQPFRVLLDIWGVITPMTFREQLYTYLFATMEDYLVDRYETPSIEGYIERISKRNHIERSRYDHLPEISCPQPGEDPNALFVRRRISKSIVENLIARRKHKLKNMLIMGLDDLFNEIWFEAYRNKKVEVPIFDDVIRSLEEWQAAPFFIKHYTFASGPEENQRLFLKASHEGERLNNLITSTFDTHRRYKYEVERYGTVVRCLGERDPSNLFYFTDSPTKAKLASRKGITAFVVLRKGNKSYNTEQLEPFKQITSLDEVTFVPADNCC